MERRREGMGKEVSSKKMTIIKSLSKTQKMEKKKIRKKKYTSITRDREKRWGRKKGEHDMMMQSRRLLCFVLHQVLYFVQYGGVYWNITNKLAPGRHGVKRRRMKFRLLNCITWAQDSCG